MSRWRKKLRCKRGHWRTPENVYASGVCKKCCCAASVRWHKTHKRRKLEIYRKHDHGILPEEFRARRRRQKNRCAICQKRFRATPRVDHSHKTKKIRGLLCHHCNCMLGFARDSVNTLRSAIIYLSIGGENERRRARPRRGETTTR